jgi:hypothetical protein
VVHQPDDHIETILEGRPDLREGLQPEEHMVGRQPEEHMAIMLGARRPEEDTSIRKSK